MSTEREPDYITPVISEGHLVEFLHWLGDSRDLADDDSYYFDQWLDFVEAMNVEQEAAQAVKH